MRVFLLFFFLSFIHSFFFFCFTTVLLLLLQVVLQSSQRCHGGRHRICIQVNISPLPIPPSSVVVCFFVSLCRRVCVTHGSLSFFRLRVFATYRMFAEFDYIKMVKDHATGESKGIVFVKFKKASGMLLFFIVITVDLSFRGLASPPGLVCVRVCVCVIFLFFLHWTRYLSSATC